MIHDTLCILHVYGNRVLYAYSMIRESSMHNMHNVCFYSLVCILHVGCSKYVDDAKRRKKSKINKLKIKLQSYQKGARGRLSSSRRQHGRKHPPRRRPPTAEGRLPTADR